ncbi:MAG: hypothetical protein FWC42_09690 [Proteobacteria bacterium]|nr:hypothetical protein [Pseudomonadota bacterium]
MSRYVPETAIDHDAIFRRGGENCGDEDFALFKCPTCGHIYLMDYEVDTVYLDGADLSKRGDLNVSFFCVSCKKEMPPGPCVGTRAKEEFMVTWQELKTSPWSWAAKPLSGFGDEA